MTKTAFQNPSGDFFHLTDEQIESGLAASRKSPRKRMILPIQRQQEAEVQRLVNFLQPGTYIRPHKHPMPHATESIVLLKGAIRFFTFDGAGDVITDQTLTSNGIPDVIDIEPGTWHSFLVQESDTIIFECKKGPYNAETDKEFAEWAPDENDERVNEYMETLAR
ncbi:MAG: cupin fold metalloprotein, WbuC family [Bacteroidetes bacterium]|jgi:cupin fold WbuC family metalloprotein|nr:cupin fold metalloprotein, WbuC family [Bacteroidota bacterium]